MPQVVVAVKAAAAWWAAFAKAHAVWAAIIKVAAMVAVSYGVGKIFGPKLGGGALNGNNPLQMSRDPAAPRRVVYGETRLSGPLIDAFVSGAENAQIHLVVALAGHECESIGDVYFNDEIIALDGAGNATGTYAGLATVKKYLGAPGQTADAISVATGQRSASDKFTNICHLSIHLTWSDSKWPAGLPNPSAIVRGKKCYDPRTATMAWTANPALCIRDYLTNTEYGMGVDVSELNEASFIAAANVCDEEVELNAGGTEPRYRCHGSFELNAEPAAVLEKLCESMAGAVVYVGGEWICYAGAHQTPEERVLTVNDLRSPVSVQAKLSLRETCNRVRGTFVSPEDNYQPADFIPIVNGMYLLEDLDREIWRDMSFAFVTSHSQAQRLAKIELERTRQEITVNASCKLTTWCYKPGDVVPFTLAEMGWNEKLFLVTSVRLVGFSAGGEQAVGVDMVLRETAAEVWDWNSGEETTYDPAANTNLIDPRSVSTPPKPTLSTSNFVQPDGVITHRIQVQWSLPTDVWITSGGYVHLEYKLAASSTWLVWSSGLRGNLQEDYITDVRAGETYHVRYRWENRARVVGGYSPSESIIVSTDTTVPDKPTGLVASAGPGCVLLDWDDNIEEDLDHYQLYRATTNNYALAALVWSGYASQHADFGVTVGVTYYYWLIASDTSDNLSAAEGEVHAAAASAAGPAGGYTEWIFIRSSTPPATPTGDNPAGWSGYPPPETDPLELLYWAVGDKTGAGVLVGAWSAPVLAQGGSITMEYSVDGLTSWHSTFTSGDIYGRHRVGSGSWTDPYRIVGENGADGIDGANGALNPNFDKGNVGWLIWSGPPSNVAQWVIANNHGETSWGAKMAVNETAAMRNLLNVRCTSGERFTIRAHMIGVNCYARITFYDASDTEIYYAETPRAGSDSDWYFREKYAVAPMTSVWCRAEVVGDTTSCAVDSVILQRLAPGVPYNLPETTVPAPQWWSNDLGSDREITLYCEDGAATIQYTVNGAGPYTYSGPFNVWPFDLVLAWATRGGYAQSTVTAIQPP